MTQAEVTLKTSEFLLEIKDLSEVYDLIKSQPNDLTKSKALDGFSVELFLLHKDALDFVKSIDCKLYGEAANTMIVFAKTMDDLVDDYLEYKKQFETIMRLIKNGEAIEKESEKSIVKQQTKPNARHNPIYPDEIKDLVLKYIEIYKDKAKEPKYIGAFILFLYEEKKLKASDCNRYLVEGIKQNNKELELINYNSIKEYISKDGKDNFNKLEDKKMKDRIEEIRSKIYG